jgi:hypothetical protein
VRDRDTRSVHLHAVMRAAVAASVEIFTIPDNAASPRRHFK